MESKYNCVPTTPSENMVSRVLLSTFYIQLLREKKLGIWPKHQAKGKLEPPSWLWSPVTRATYVYTGTFLQVKQSHLVCWAKNQIIPNQNPQPYLAFNQRNFDFVKPKIHRTHIRSSTRELCVLLPPVYDETIANLAIQFTKPITVTNCFQGISPFYMMMPSEDVH